MRGSIRHRAGAWRLQVYAGTDQNGRKQRVTRTVPGPDTKKGRAVAEHELARLVLEVEAGQVKVAHKLTVAELLERWQRARAADWSVKTANETAGMIRRYIAPHIGARPIDKVRPVEIDALYALLLEQGGTGVAGDARGRAAAPRGAAAGARRPVHTGAGWCDGGGLAGVVGVGAVRTEACAGASVDGAGGGAVGAAGG